MDHFEAQLGSKCSKLRKATEALQTLAPITWAFSSTGTGWPTTWTHRQVLFIAWHLLWSAWEVGSPNITNNLQKGSLAPQENHPLEFLPQLLFLRSTAGISPFNGSITTPTHRSRRPLAPEVTDHLLDLLVSRVGPERIPDGSPRIRHGTRSGSEC